MYDKYLKQCTLIIIGAYNWTKEETLLLLNLYNEYKDKFSGGKGTVKKCWNKIANIMQDKGYNVTGIKCSTKLQALKRTYKFVVDHNNKSGNNPKEWEYFKVKYIFQICFYIKICVHFIIMLHYFNYRDYILYFRLCKKYSRISLG